MPHIGGTKWGLALQGDTSIEVFDSFLDFDFIMFMTTVPGVSGGKFDKSCFRKIRNFRSKYQNKQIFVDGGVNAATGALLAEAGSDALVAGNAVFKDADPHAVISALRTL